MSRPSNQTELARRGSVDPKKNAAAASAKDSPRNSVNSPRPSVKDAQSPRGSVNGKSSNKGKKSSEKGGKASKDADDNDPEVSRTSLSKKERLALQKLPPGQQRAMSQRNIAAPGVGDSKRGSVNGLTAPNTNKAGPLSSAQAAAVAAAGSGSGRRGSQGAVPAATVAQMAAKNAQEQKQKQVDERKKAKSAQQFIDGLVRASTLNRNNEAQVIEASKKTFQQFDADIRRKNITMAVLGTLIMTLVVVTLQYPWDEDRAFYDRSLNSMHVVEVVCSALTGILMYYVYDYYMLQVDLDRLRYRQKFRAPLYKTSFFIPFFLEMCVCFLHPVPFTDQRKMGMLAFMKLYLWVRVYRDFSSVYRWRQDAIDACDASHGIPRFTSWLSLRTLFYQWPWMFVSCSVIVSVVLQAFMIHVVEREVRNESCLADPCNCPAAAGTYTCLSPRGLNITVTAAQADAQRSCCHSPFKFPAICLYYTCVTMTTVGFGDYATLSSWGRGISMWAAVTGICLSALLVTALLTEFSLSFSQKFAADFVSIKQLTIRERELAATLIQRWYRRLSLNKGHYRMGERKGLNTRGKMGGLMALDNNDQSHLPSNKTRARGSWFFGDTVDESLIWALKDFRQHRITKEQTLTMDSEGGTGLFKSIVQMTRAYEIMTEKVVTVEKQQRRFQLTLKKLVLLFAKLPQSMDADALIPLGLGASISDSGHGHGHGQGPSNSVPVALDASSSKDAAAAAAANAQAQAQIQKQQQVIQSLQKQISSAAQETTDARMRQFRAEEKADRYEQELKNATVAQGPLRYRKVSSVIQGLQAAVNDGSGGAPSPAPGGAGASGPAAAAPGGGGSGYDSDSERSTHVTSASYSAAGARAQGVGGNSAPTTSVSGSVSASVAPSRSGVNDQVYRQLATAPGPSAGADTILSITDRQPTQAELDDPNVEWEEVVVQENNNASSQTANRDGQSANVSILNRQSISNDVALQRFQQQQQQQQQQSPGLGLRIHRGSAGNGNGSSAAAASSGTGTSPLAPGEQSSSRLNEEEDDGDDDEDLPSAPAWK